MKKKVVATCATVALAAVALGGATLAYFTDTEQATNVMTVGNVSINLKEYMQVEGEDGKLTKVEFEGDKTAKLYPVTDEQGVNMCANKIVEVTNDSTSGDAVYMRVLVAFESLQDGKEDNPLLHFAGVHSTGYESDYGVYGMNYTYYGEVTIDSDVYDVYVFNVINGEAVPVGKKVQPMSRVWLDETATNEDMEALGTDGKMNILVLAQGVQTANFNDAAAAFAATFELTDDNIVSWFSAAGSDDASGSDEIDG